MVMASLRNHVLSICSKSMILYQGDSLFHSYTLYLKSDTVLSFATNHLPDSRVLLERLTSPVLQSNTKLAKRFQQLQQTNNFVVAECRNRKSSIPLSYSGGTSLSVGSETGWPQDFRGLLQFIPAKGQQGARLKLDNRFPHPFQFITH